MTDKTGVKLVTKADLELIIKRLETVKQAGYGKVLIIVKENNIVYVSQEIGEQVKMELV